MLRRVQRRIFIVCMKNSLAGGPRAFVKSQPRASCDTHLILLIILGYCLPVGAYVWGRMSSWKMLPSWEMLPLSCADFQACVYEISAVCHWQNPKSTSNVSLGHGDYLLQWEAKCFETGPLGQTAHTRWQSLISHISLSLSIARNPGNCTEGKLMLSIYEPQECSCIF